MNKIIASISLAFLLFAPALAEVDKASQNSQPTTISQAVVSHCNGRVKGNVPVVKSESQVSSHSTQEETTFQKLRVIPAPAVKTTVANR